MGRKLKPYKVDVVSSPKGDANLMLDRNSKLFFGEVGGVRVEATTAEECRRKIYHALLNFDGFDWQQKILLTFRWNRDADEGRSHHSYDGHMRVGGDIDLAFHRFEVAQSHDGSWLQRRFTNDKKQPVFGSSRGHGEQELRKWYRDPEDFGEDDLLLDYTDELWEALSEICDRLAELGRRLDALVRSDPKQLVATMQKLLPGKVETKKKRRKRS